MRITALSCLSIVVGACADPPALGEHAAAATVGDYETTSCSTAVVLELSRQIAGEVGCMAPGQLVTFPEGNGLVFTGGAVDYAVRLDRDVHALCGFSAYALPQLTGLGWRVAVAPDYPWQTRVDLLPALLNILDSTSSLDQLARTPRRCIAVPVGDKRYLPVPPERLRLLLSVLRELYRERDPLYRRTAHFVVESVRPSVPALTGMVLMQLELAGLVDPAQVPAQIGAAPATPTAGDALQAASKSPAT